MFPRFREQIGTALDLIVEFSTLGEYRLGVFPTPGAPCAPADAPGQAPRLGGTGEIAERSAVRRNVAGGAAGNVPVATPAARRHAVAGGQGDRRRASAPYPRPESRPRRRSRKGAPVVPEQLCLAV
ncbi:MAG TPA: hypothetical protein VE270_05455 [Thermoleophilaceae bacterium]|jgi:hypothetical protein|nr:hypothetical protein [Thermoleophilaceae bacterium]